MYNVHGPPTPPYHGGAFSLSISLRQNQEVSESRMDAFIWYDGGWRRGISPFLVLLHCWRHLDGVQTLSILNGVGIRP